MIYEEREEIRITGGAPEWQATYSWDRFDGPLSLSISGIDVLTGCSTRFDDFHEDLVVIDQCKAYRKGHGAMVGKSGRMPIGAETGYKSSHRYSNNALKVVKDFFVPRGVEIHQEIVIDELTLDGGFEECMSYSDGLEPGDWTPIGDVFSWPSLPIVLCLKHASGLVLEIGRGNDLWRWNDGFLPETDIVCGAELRRNGDHLTLSRFGVQVDETTAIVPRSFRFSWYLAWSTDASPAPSTSAVVQLTHRPNGDVAMGALADALSAHPGAVIEMDVAAIPLPDSLLSSGGIVPCLASNQTIKRFKRVIRQLSGLRTDGVKLLRFKNLVPATCTVGGHVHGKGERLHWDMGSIMDFGLWVRQTLGEDWELSVDAELDLPSLKEAFARTDHLEPPIEYEYTPDAT